MLKERIVSMLVIALAAGIGFWVYQSELTKSQSFSLGLDLSGGTHLVFEADTSRLTEADIPASMQSLRDTVERRVNVFGVSEPLVYTETSSLLGDGGQRLIVELPGVTDTQEAIDMIGRTPVLDFRIRTDSATTSIAAGFTATPLTGRYLSRAQLEFDTRPGALNQPIVALIFNSEGADLFEQITRENTGKVLGIFLDGQPISLPVINEPITGGQAVISGGFTAGEARLLVRDLNFGALPVPITVATAQTVGATLGAEAVAAGIEAAVFGVLAVMVFMLLWYRLPGLLAIGALLVYLIVMLALFKALPVVLTAAGIAGLILSMGMAVDANVLIFERMKEELRAGRSTKEAIVDGFKRAWPAIRDGNITSIISAVILFWFGTSLIKGFALVFGIGVLVSMFSAIMVTRGFLLALSSDRRSRIMKFLFGSGISI